MRNIEDVILELRKKKVYLDDIEQELMYRNNSQNESLDKKMTDYTTEELEDAYNFWCEY